MKSLSFPDVGGDVIEMGPASTTKPRLWVGLLGETRRALVSVKMARKMRNYLDEWIKENA